jgi:predicted anti-sigma-YlaC factor YlaD
MNCKKAQELILTDYLDGQMDNKSNILLEEHMANCRTCKEFCATAKKVGDKLLAAVDRVNPPEFVWRRVKESIIVEQRKKAAFPAKFFEKIRYAFYIPNPALAFATIFALILVFGAITRLTVHDRAMLNVSGQEQAEYLDYSGDIIADVSANDEAGFGTSIEKYFL